MESVQNCNCCGSDKFSLLLTKDSFSIVKCKNCGLVFSESFPSQEELSSLYSKEFFTDQTRLQYYIADEGTNIIKAQSKLKTVVGYKKDGRLLDVGCAFGTFLKLMKENGWETWGSEISGYAADYSRKSTGSKIISGDFLNADFSQEHFDVVTMWDYIEHVKDPYSNLKKAEQLLKNGGFLFISTVDIGSLFAKILGKRWKLIKPKLHLYYFDQKSIFGLLKKAGFKVVEKKNEGRYFNLEYLLRTSAQEYRSRCVHALCRGLLNINDKTKILPKRVYINFGDIMTVTAVKPQK
ncbi:MAG: methyltransferase domain-containing protein [Candidatus Omnitrophica bacterium]|nr:methyltransferase domain-containing protein [Candidatus Omnitrophota bacterium]